MAYLPRRMRWLAGIAVLWPALAGVAPAGAADGLTSPSARRCSSATGCRHRRRPAARTGSGRCFNARSCTGCHRGGGGRRPRLKVPACRGIWWCACPPAAPYGRQLQTACGARPDARGQAGRCATRMCPVLLADGTTVVLRRPDLRCRRRGFRAGSGAACRRGWHRRCAASACWRRSLPGRSPRAPIRDDRDGDGIRGRVGAGRFGLRAEQPACASRSRTRCCVDLGLATTLRAEPGGRLHGGPGGLPHCAARRRGWPAGGRGRRRDPGQHSSPTSPPCRRHPHRRAAMTRPAPHCSARSAARPAMRPRSAGRPPRPIPISCCTIWAPSWPTRVPRPTRPRACGARRRCGGSARRAALLHDGRARDAQEAILWHGGEAEPARERFRALDAAARDQLLRFLAGL